MQWIFVFLHLYWRKFDQEIIALRSGDNKIIEMPEEKMLYDISKDISEETNLKETNPQKFKKTNLLYMFLTGQPDIIIRILTIKCQKWYHFHDFLLFFGR